MTANVTGGAIRALRERRGMTQRALAEELSVSDKTISKWEAGRGLPDVSLLEPLAAALRVSVAELMDGRYVNNQNRQADLRRGRFYVCPACGNVVWAVGEGAFHCCGAALEPLEPERAEGAVAVTVETVEGEWYVTADHPMTKEHYLTFLAVVSDDGLQLRKLYPQQTAQCRFSKNGGDTLYLCTSRRRLYQVRL